MYEVSYVQENMFGNYLAYGKISYDRGKKKKKNFL